MCSVTDRFLFHSVTSEGIEHGATAMKSTNLKLIKSTVMRPVAATGRKLNKAYRTREHLTEERPALFLRAHLVREIAGQAIGVLRDLEDPRVRPEQRQQ